MPRQRNNHPYKPAKIKLVNDQYLSVEDGFASDPMTGVHPISISGRAIKQVRASLGVKP